MVIGRIVDVELWCICAPRSWRKSVRRNHSHVERFRPPASRCRDGDGLGYDGSLCGGRVGGTPYKISACLAVARLECVDSCSGLERGVEVLRLAFNVSMRFIQPGA